MMRSVCCVVGGIAGLLLTATVVPAQTKAAAPVENRSVTPSPDRTAGGRILLPETGDEASPAVPSTDFSSRPVRPERAIAPEVREYLHRFRSARETYLKEQAVFEKQLKGSTEEERRLIRQRMKDSLDRWQAQARTFREEARERQREIKRNLPKHRQAFDETRPGVRERRPAGLD